MFISMKSYLVNSKYMNKILREILLEIKQKYFCYVEESEIDPNEQLLCVQSASWDLRLYINLQKLWETCRNSSKLCYKRYEFQQIL